MQKTLIALVGLLSVSTSVSALAAEPIALTPGLWHLQLKMKQDGKDFDPQAQLQEALKKMPPEQRKLVAETMKKQGVVTDGKGFQVCYTREMLAKGHGLSADPSGQCDSQITEQTAALVKMTFTCKDGTKGKGEFKLGDGVRFMGHINTTKPGGQKLEMAQEGKFLKADCGDVKPTPVR